MSTVLVIKPDEVQADVLRRIFAKRVGADLVIVDSTNEAVHEISANMPDLILLSALLSPRDEDALIAHLRTLDNASHLQTITIPQFRTGVASAPAKKGGLFSKKAKAQAPMGCDPMEFAEALVGHLKEACEIRNRPQAPKPPINVIAPAEPPRYMEDPQASSSAFDATPFRSQYGSPESVIEEPAASPLEYVAEPIAFVPEPEPIREPEPAVYRQPEPEPALEPELLKPRAVPKPIEIDEIDRLAKELGLNLKYSATDAAPPPAPAPVEEEDVFDFGAALDRARNAASGRRSTDISQAELDAEAIREAAIAEAREVAEREAREAVAADLARVQAEAEAMREAAIAEARQAEAMREAAVAEAREAAERAAREKLDAELARIREEAELTVAAALNKVKQETEEAERLRAEEARLRAEEAERLRAEEARLRAEEAERVRAEAELARAEAERVRLEAEQAQEAFEAELARVRAEVEQSLAAQLETARKDAERSRAAEAATARERAAVEAQLKAELDRLKFVATQARKADQNEAKKATDQIKQLEGELARVHAQAEQRQAAQLQDLRTQMAEMREAAAQQARAAAAEAVASEVARANAHANESAPRRLNVVRMQPRVPMPEQPVRAVARPQVQEMGEPVQAAPASATCGDYLKFFQANEAQAPKRIEVEPELVGAGIDYKRHAKWALPVAACLLLVTGTGTAISTVARFVKTEEKPKLVVERVNPDPFIEVVEQRVGSLKIDSTPEGAEVIVDGKSHGTTPLTILDLEVGNHTLVLKHDAGTITRRFTIKNNTTTMMSEAIFSGWLAIFSPIPVTVLIDGQAVSLNDEGRVMTTPGKHQVEFISERFNYRSTETLDVTPGETTAHTLNLPMGSVRVMAPEGAEIKVDGVPASGSPADGLQVAIGSHEISATHPSLGERRASVDVRHGAVTEVALQFE